MSLTGFVPLIITLGSLLWGGDEAEIVFVGDAMQHTAQLDAAKNPHGDYDYTHCLDSLPDCVAMADLAVVNLETPVGKAPYSGYPCFNAPESFASSLADAGFDLFLTANNHTLDRGAGGLRSTVQVLDALGMHHTGTYANDSCRRAQVPMVQKVSGIPIAFLNYTYGTNGNTPRQGVVVDYIDRARIKADVDSARSRGAEMIAVCIHWGDEYVLLPNKSQKATADFLEALGVDMIIGSHPHVIQPMELRPNLYYPEKQLLLVYSLGNFISNMKTPDTRGGALVRVKLKRPKGASPVIDQAGYKLLFTIPGTSPTRNFGVFEASKVTGPWKIKADMFAKRARAIFDKHNVNVEEF